MRYIQVHKRIANSIGISGRVRTVSLTDGSVLNDHLIEGEAGTEEIPWALDFSMYCIDDILVCTTWVDGIIGQHPSLVDVVLLDTTSGRIVAVSNQLITPRLCRRIIDSRACDVDAFQECHNLRGSFLTASF